jgi:hypothetical protein
MMSVSSSSAAGSASGAVSRDGARRRRRTTAITVELRHKGFKWLSRPDIALEPSKGAVERRAELGSAPVTESLVPNNVTRLRRAFGIPLEPGRPR